MKLLALPPPPPPPPPPLSPPPQKQTMSTPLRQIVISKQPMNQHIPVPNTSDPAGTRKVKKQQTLLRQPRRTNPMVWFSAILCLIFSLILIFFGIATLIIFLVVKPKTPLFDVPGVSLSSIYFDSPEYFNGDFTFLANFSNPNRKIDVKFEFVYIELYFSNRLIGTQTLPPFRQRRRETRLETVHLISSLVSLPTNLGLELRRQVQVNKVTYDIRGSFRVRAKLGLIHFSYWLHGRCQLEMTGPPTGVLVTRSCRTKR